MKPKRVVNAGESLGVLFGGRPEFVAGPGDPEAAVVPEIQKLPSSARAIEW
jgi:hypothetical protein